MEAHSRNPFPGLSAALVVVILALWAFLRPAGEVGSHEVSSPDRVVVPAVPDVDPPASAPASDPDQASHDPTLDDDGEPGPQPRRVTEGPVLVVVDRDSGRPLPSARAVPRTRSGGWRWSSAYPGAPVLAQGTVYRADEEGQIHIPGDDGSARYPPQMHVVADGHAWVLVRPDYGAESQVVALGPGGTARVRIPRADGLPPSMLKVRPGGADWMLREVGEGHPLPADGTVVVEGLPAGSVRFMVSSDPFASRVLTFGATDAEIVAGAETTVVLDVDVPEFREKATVTGLLDVPEASTFGSLRVEFEGIEEANSWVRRSQSFPREPGAETPTYTIADVPAGRYLVHVPPAWYVVKDIPPGESRLDLHVPAYVPVRIRAVDDRTGRPVRRVEVQWYPVCDEASEMEIHGAAFDETDGIAMFFAPPGQVNVTVRRRSMPSAGSGGMTEEACEDMVLEVPAAGEVSRTVRLVAFGRVTIRLRFPADGPGSDGKGEDVGVTLRVAEKDGTGNMSMSGSLDGENTWSFDLTPGRYTVSASLEGDAYVPAAEQEVDVRADEEATVTLEFLRR